MKNSNSSTRLAIIALVAWLAPAAAAVAAAGDLGDFVASLEGGWHGEQNPTPLGPMPFTALFERREDGSLHSRSALNRETYVDLRFSRDEAGRWLLHEEAGMEELGVHRYTLAPAGRHQGRHRWVYEPDPHLLTVDVGLEGRTLLLDVRLRGEDHVSFRLDRLPDEELPELARQMAVQAAQSPDEGISITELIEGARGPREHGAAAESGSVDDSVSEARRQVAAEPESAEAHLALARAFGDAINQSPANGPRYAFEMVRSLETAIHLDPGLTEAYHWLVGYYLNAPPIAGGSIAKAEETARRLAELDSAGAEELMRQIDARRPQR